MVVRHWNYRWGERSKPIKSRISNDIREMRASFTKHRKKSRFRDFNG